MASSSASWGRPFRLAPARSTDVTPPRIAFSQSGDAAIGFGTQDEQVPAIAAAFVTVRSRTGALSAPVRVPGAKQLLDLAYDGSTLELLIGSAPAGQGCCQTVGAIPLQRGKLGREHVLLRNLGGATAGRLTPLAGGGLLASIATSDGVWAAQSSKAHGFAPAARLTSSATMPSTLAAAALAHGRTAIAWTQTTQAEPYLAPAGIFLAEGSARRFPAQAVPAITVASGHSVDELELAAGASGVTAAWIEGWFDSAGGYHSQPVVADLAAGAGANPFPPPAGELASGVELAADPRGDQVLAWKECDAAAVCEVLASARRAGAHFGVPSRLGAIDAYEDPAASVTSGGQGLVGWINGGVVVAATRPVAAAAFSGPRRLSPTNGASELTISSGPAGEALASWTQGASAQELVGAAYSAP